LLNAKDATLSAMVVDSFRERIGIPWNPPFHPRTGIGRTVPEGVLAEGGERQR